MKGLLKTKSGLSQLLLLISIALVSFVVIGAIGGLIAYAMFGKSLGIKGITDLASLDYSQPAAVTMIRALQVVQFISLFLIPSFFCAYFFSSNTKRYLGFRKPDHKAYWIAGIALLLLAIPFTNLLGELNKLIPFPKAIEEWMRKSEEEAAKAIRALLSQRSLKDLLLNIFFIAGLAAIGEELLFRGMVQRLFIKIFKSPWIGIIIAAILFSAIHMQFYGFFPRFVLGLLLGAIYWYSGSLYAAMLAHFVYDAFVIVVAWYNPETMEETTAAGMNLTAVSVAAAVGLFAILLILRWMRNHSRQSMETVFADDSIPVKDHPF